MSFKVNSYLLKINKIYLVIIFNTLLVSCGSDDDDVSLSTPPTEVNQTLSLQAGTNLITIMQDISGNNVNRNVYIKTPQNFDESQSYPSVFVFHGAGGNANQFVNNQNLEQIINSQNFIGVFPQGYANSGGQGGFWNLGSEPTDADDVQFVTLIVEKLASYKGVNTNRRYAIGFSNGAGMVNLLGKSTQFFNAIAPTFSQQITKIGAINSNHAISVFQINGETDGLIPINGGTSSVGEFMSASDSALNWANTANCSTTPSNETQTWGSKTVEITTYSHCDNNHEIKMAVAKNTNHGWQDQQAEAAAFEHIANFLNAH